MNIAKTRAVLNMFPRSDSRKELRLKLFLADWKHALSTGQTITGAIWTRGMHGPENRKIEAFIAEAYRDRPESLLITLLASAANLVSDLFPRQDAEAENSILTEAEAASVAHVVERTCDLPFSELIRLVYSTRPVYQIEIGTILDLPKSAAEQKAEMAARANEEPGGV